MLFNKQIFAACFFLLCFHIGNAQIEVDYAHGKDYNSIGFGGFLNFSFPVSESDYLTIEGGVQYFNSSDDEELALIPVLAGYRYTLDRSGSGFYVEPFAGYAFGSSTIGSYDSYGAWEGGSEKVAGPEGGLGAGYLFDIGNIPFNLEIRFQHNFGHYGTNIAAFRISHSFGFRKRDEY